MERNLISTINKGMLHKKTRTELRSCEAIDVRQVNICSIFRPVTRLKACTNFKVHINYEAGTNFEAGTDLKVCTNSTANTIFKAGTNFKESIRLKACSR